MFNTTSIIYVYIYIIISLIVFDLFYTMNEKVREKRGKKKLEKYKNAILKEIAKNNIENIVDENHRKKLLWHLRRINNLLIYQEAIKSLKKECPYKIDSYLVRYTSVFQVFSQMYRHKDSIYKAFFASFLSKYYPFHLNKSTQIDAAIMEYVGDKSIYCRENAMLYFYERGSSQLVISALKKIDEEHLYYNQKLLSNDLLKFHGNKKRLARQLFKEFSHFSSQFQVSIINYLRFANLDLKSELYAMLTSGEYDKEVNLAIIRYFGKEVYDEVLPFLLQILESDSSTDIEYKIIVCQIAPAYEKSAMKDALISSISDDNWYVRKNATKALSNMHLTNREKQKILLIEDRYGKQMVEYTFLKKNLKKKEEVLV